jgi:hypothetical protein
MGGCFSCKEARTCLVHKDLPLCLCTDLASLQKVGACVRLPENYPMAR